MSPLLFLLGLIFFFLNKLMARLIQTPSSTSLLPSISSSKTNVASLSITLETAVTKGPNDFSATSQETVTVLILPNFSPLFLVQYSPCFFLTNLKKNCCQVCFDLHLSTGHTVSFGGRMRKRPQRRTQGRTNRGNQEIVRSQRSVQTLQSRAA